ncbi:hypothetical protein CP970_13855 [Streptomyces kanamyceticus]|uniref:Uncharacterized protein n=1 Tax=Streptomyces kanamyceticus TaxID=1967 RepID=A0A5J6GF68_STRKN|nr:hypothetical protein CP970_13855 [Streptomyces kanamyceticus]
MSVRRGPTGRRRTGSGGWRASRRSPARRPGAVRRGPAGPAARWPSHRHRHGAHRQPPRPHPRPERSPPARPAHPASPRHPAAPGTDPPGPT